MTMSSNMRSWHHFSASSLFLSILSVFIILSNFYIQPSSSFGIGDTIGRLSISEEYERIQSVVYNSQSTVPQDLVIALLGFDGEGDLGITLEQSQLQSLLKKALPYHRPSSLQSKHEISTRFELHYEVLHLPASYLNRIESVLRQEIEETKAYQQLSRFRGLRHSFEVEATKIEPILDEVYSQIVKYSEHDKSEGKRTEKPLTIFLMNPKKNRILPPPAATEADKQPQPIDYTYRYTYGHSEGVTSHWIAGNRYVVFDASSGPVEFGMMDTGGGVVHPTRFPEIYHATTFSSLQARKDRIMAELSTIVVSAVRQVFFPDLFFDLSASQLDATKVHIPIVVLRNHDLWDPTNNNRKDTYIDVDQIKSSISSLMGSDSTQIAFMQGMHDIRDHPHVSSAILRALKGTTSHEADPRTKTFSIKSKHYLDGKLLSSGLQASGDPFTSALIPPPPPELRNPLLHLSSPSSSSSSPTTPSSRILPVYILSLFDLPDNVLIDGDSLVFTSPEMIIVLQTNETSVPSTSFSERRTMNFRPSSSATKSVIEGLAKALYGISPPTERFSAVSKVIQSEMMWAFGKHPFGVFSTSNEFSQLHQAVAKRSPVLMRLQASQQSLKRTMKTLHSFVQREIFVADVKSADVDGSEGDDSYVLQYSSAFWNYVSGSNAETAELDDEIDVEDEKASEVSMVRESLRSMFRQLTELEAQFKRASDLLHLQQLTEASKITASLSHSVQAFESFVGQELRNAKHRLECCVRQAAEKRGGSSSRGLEKLPPDLFTSLRRQKSDQDAKKIYIAMALICTLFLVCVAVSCVVSGEGKEFFGALSSAKFGSAAASARSAAVHRRPFQRN